MNKNIVVVGASSGIGKALVACLISHKDTNIFALSRKSGQLKKCFSGAKNLVCIDFDLTKNVREQLDNSPLSNIQVDYLINNAGLLVKKDFRTLTQEDFNISFQTNAIGVMQTVQALQSNFNPNFAHIVNISTMGALQGSAKFPELIAYGTSKAALCTFTEVYAEEFKNTQIRMNCLCLGAVNTDMLKEAFPGFIADVEPNEMAEFILHFTLHSGRLMNGKLLPISRSTP